MEQNAEKKGSPLQAQRGYRHVSEQGFAEYLSGGRQGKWSLIEGRVYAHSWLDEDLLQLIRRHVFSVKDIMQSNAYIGQALR